MGKRKGVLITGVDAPYLEPGFSALSLEMGECGTEYEGYWHQNVARCHPK